MGEGCGETCGLLWVVRRIAVEPGKDTATDPIGEFNHNTMLICLRKPALKDELDDRMIELPPAMGDDIGWWRNPECLHVAVGKAIWQLGDAGSGILGWVGPATTAHTLGRYAR